MLEGQAHVKLVRHKQKEVSLLAAPPLDAFTAGYPFLGTNYLELV